MALESSGSQGSGADGGFVDRLPAETRRWQDQGIITAEQAQAIVSTYGLTPGVAAGQRARGRLITILAICGSVLVGLGIILSFAANWGEIPRTVRLAMIMIGLPSIYALGYWLKYVRSYHRVGTATLLLAAILYGAGIHLIAQVYNFPVNDPKLVSLWFLGVLPLAYLTRSQAILVLAQALFLSAVGFWVTEWLDGQDEGVAIFGFALYLTLGLFFYGLGKLQSQYNLTRPYAQVFEVAGLLVMMASVYLLSFRFLYDFSSYQERGVDVEVATKLCVLFYLAGAAAVQVRRRLPLMTLPYEGLATVLLLALAYLVVHVAAGNDVVYPVLFNLALLAGIAGLVFAGYLLGREYLINIGLMFFGLDVITRYFELSWGMLNSSLGFIVAGLILLGGGYLLERGRRKVFEPMEAQGGMA